MQLGWLEHAPDGYGMGWRSLKYRNNDSISSRIRAEAAPLLHDLQIRTGKVVHLAVLEGANIRYLDKLGGPTAVTIPSRVGGVNPAHGTALGKSMLAWMDPEDLDEIFASGLPGVTGKTLTDSALLYSELARIRRRGGLAYETGESYEGITCVASAIRIGAGGSAGSAGRASNLRGAQCPGFDDRLTGICQSLRRSLACSQAARSWPPNAGRHPMEDAWQHCTSFGIARGNNVMLGLDPP